MKKIYLFLDFIDRYVFLLTDISLISAIINLLKTRKNYQLVRLKKKSQINWCQTSTIAGYFIMNKLIRILFEVSDGI